MNSQGDTINPDSCEVKANDEVPVFPVATKLLKEPLPVVALVPAEPSKLFMVNLDTSKASAKLGIVVDFSSGSSAIISSIHDGLIQQWNLQNPGEEVCVEDQIVEVNKFRGSAEQLIDRCRTEKSLQILLARYPSNQIVSSQAS